MKALVAGWFSFVDGHATAGDLLTRDVVCDWLDRMELSHDVALAAPFMGGVDWRRVDSRSYSHVLFVCGPFQRSAHEYEFLDRFANCRLVGLNLSMSEPTSDWDPFDLLLERDSVERVRPDLVFLSRAPKVPVIGLCLVESYPGALVKKANEALERLAMSHEVAVIRIDTRLDHASHNTLRTAAEIESLLGRIDLLLTSRLHGLVLALKNAVPAVAIDPEPGGAKIRRQAQLLGWEPTFVADALDEQALDDAFLYGLTDDARAKANECAKRALQLLRDTPRVFAEEMRGDSAMERRYQVRLAGHATRTSTDHFDSTSLSLWQRQKARLKQVRKRLSGFRT